MAKPITGKTHVGERRENRPNGDIYIYKLNTYTQKRQEKSTVFQLNRAYEVVLLA